MVSFHSSETLVDVPRSTSIPEFCDGVPVSSELRTIMLSPILTSLLLTVVVVPETVRLPPTVTFPEVSTVVKVPAAAVVAPIVTLSIEPPLISAVSATKLSILAVPSINKSLNSKELEPKSMSLSVTGRIAPSAM